MSAGTARVAAVVEAPRTNGGGAQRVHPPLEGEGRIAEGNPGWGDGRAVDDGVAPCVEALSPPPGPVTRADLPPPGGGEELSSPALYRLMTWMSPAYPVGAFSYSAGLEWAVEAGDIRDACSLTGWLTAMIRYGSVFCDAALFCHAHRAAACGDDRALAATAELAAALVGSKERLLETTAQGQAFLRVTQAAWTSPALDRLTAAWDGPVAYPVVVAAACAGHGIALVPALQAFLHGVASNLVSAGVRLIPLGQTDGQRVLAALEAEIAGTAQRALATAHDDIGSATLRADIAGMHHETQHTRLFRS
jgi:urease accessory protein